MRQFITQKMIDKAKKKLKKLQKRQRKQDNQGVVSFDAYFAESNELIKKLGDVWAAGIKDIYGKEYHVSADQWPSDTLDKFLAGQNEPYVINMIKHAIITDEMMDAMRERYEINKINPLINDIINAPVITERLDVSERPIVCDVDMKPRIIDTMTIEEFIKWRDKMARPS